MQANKKNILFGVLLAVGIVLLLEISLRVASAMSPRVSFVLTQHQNYALDPVLGWRPHIGQPGHDRWGYRNTTSPSDAEVVVFGDSQTYGTGMPLEESWPSQLAAMSGVDIYQIAFGGWGPIHNVPLMEEAKEMGVKPRIVIEAVYLGNDIFDAYETVYLLDLLTHWIPEDPDVLAAIAAAESSGPERFPLPNLQKTQAEFEKQVNPLRKALSENSRLYGMLRAIKRITLRPWEDDEKTQLYFTTDWEAVKTRALANTDQFQVVETDDYRTIMTPRLRFEAMDLDDARIAEGFRITLDAMKIVDDQTKEMGAEHLVLFIPTKELVFEDQIHNGRYEPTEMVLKSIESEKRVTLEAKAFLDAHDIPHIDALPYLRRCLVEGLGQPYPLSGNGHPNEIGYRAVAQTVLDYLKQTDLSKSSM